MNWHAATRLSWIRAGAADARVPILACVSCNPVSFAADAAHLVQNGYSLNWARAVERFRWSAHVELAASLTLHHMAGDRR